jgi:hypothetical protein
MPTILQGDEYIDVTASLTRDATWRVLDLTPFSPPANASGVIMLAHRHTDPANSNTHFGIRAVGGTLTGNAAYRMSDSSSAVNTGVYQHAPITGTSIEYYSVDAVGMSFYICGWWLQGEIVDAGMVDASTLYTETPVDLTWIPVDLTGVPGYSTDYTAVIVRCVNDTGTSNRVIGHRPDSSWGEVSYNGYHTRYANDIIVPITNGHFEVKGSIISAYLNHVVAWVKGAVALPPATCPDTDDTSTYSTTTVPGVPTDAVAVFTTYCQSTLTALYDFRTPGDTAEFKLQGRLGLARMAKPTNGQLEQACTGSNDGPLKVVGGYFLPASSPIEKNTAAAGGSGSRGVDILRPKVHTRDIKRRGWRRGRR